MIRVTTLRAAAEVALGRQRSPQHAEGPHMVPYLRAANVKDGELDLSDVLSMNFGPDEQQIFSLRPGDVLVTEGSGSLRSVGASAVWSGELDGVVCFQNTLLRLRPRKGIDGSFLLWWARSAYGSGLFASVATGANIYHLGADRVRALPIELPGIDEQRRIAEFLDAETARIDRLLRTQALLIDRVRERESVAIEQIMMQASVGSVRLKYLLLSPISYGANESAQAYDSAWPRYVRTTDIAEDGTLRDDTLASISPEAASGYMLKDGDLLIARSGATVGKSFVYEEHFGPAAHAGYLVKAQINRELVSPRLIWYFCQTHSYRQQISEGSIQATIQNVSAEKYGNLIVPLVEAGEQDRTLRSLNSYWGRSREFQSRATNMLNLLAERRQALITAAVTGQFDVSTASGRGVDVP